eukprot:GEMP01043412.1.p1 GENE.GEMP01043412.1~~GEMP01043412.1.p1  ORF type:complete len:309 (-),score=39.83 GEMP01043412.1:783-1709(-)
MTSLKTLLQISRPGWWLVNVWLYLAPTAQRWELFYSPMFWFGLVYVTLPLNLLVFGMNDISDVEIDKDNPRKGNFIFGAKCAKADLVGAMKFILWSNLACLVFILFTIDAPGYFLAVFCVGLGANIAYNFEPLRLSSKCPFEFLCVISGFFVISLVSSLLNDLPLAPAKYWLHTACRIIRHQLWTEYMDIEVDGAKERRTTAVVLGEKLTICAVVVSYAAEVVVSVLLFDDFVLRAYSTARLVILLCMQHRPNSIKSEANPSSKCEGSISSEIRTTNKAKKNRLIHIIQISLGLAHMVYLWLSGVLIS